ncbi:MAG TPA: hypothetical protein VFQ22_05165 [Longimicrobiales bacterium]|nr:hypothetical protein [Longimicrobiales bacterium]
MDPSVRDRSAGPSPRLAPAALVALALASGCARSPEPPGPPPVSPALESAMYTSVLERVLMIDLFQVDVAGICVGLGEEAETPSMDLLVRFMGGEPPLYPAGSCSRRTDPATALPVIDLPDGEPAALVLLTHRPWRSGRLVEMRVERTGMHPMLIRCRVDLDDAPEPDPAVPGGEAIGFRLRGC